MEIGEVGLECIQKHDTTLEKCMQKHDTTSRKKARVVFGLHSHFSANMVLYISLFFLSPAHALSIPSVVDPFLCLPTRSLQTPKCSVVMMRKCQDCWDGRWCICRCSCAEMTMPDSMLGWYEHARGES